MQLSDCMSNVSAEGHVEQGEEGCVSVFWLLEFFQRFGRWAQWTNLAPVLAEVVVLAGSEDRMIIALCHISGISPVEMDRLKMQVR